MEALHTSAFDETVISTEIARRYFDKLLSRITSDVLIAGAGPSGLLAAHLLAEEGYEVTVIEKRLSPGGGVWGGSMAMNEGAIQEEGIPLLDKLGVRYASRGGDVATVDTVELASALCLRAIQSGAIVFNLTTVEDLCLRDGRIIGLVVNRSNLEDFQRFIPEKFGVEVVLGTHPIPRSYLETHGALATWDAPEWQERIREVLAPEEVRAAYD